MRYIYGLHDPAPDDWLEKYLSVGNEPRGWIVFTEALGHDPNDYGTRDYSRWSDFGVLVRLNHGYYPEGTIPLEQDWEGYVQRVTNFVRGSIGCSRWIVGNEMNMSWERPQGQVITAAWYAELFSEVRRAIRDIPGHTQDEVIPGAVAPWNVDTGDWLAYFKDLLYYCDKYGGLDGICLHTYTHGSDPELVGSLDKMDPPYEDRYYHFLAYGQFLWRVPSTLRSLPVYITETNQDAPWLNAPNTWAQEAYDLIDLWNATNEQKVHCLCLYCWDMRDDGKYISDKPFVWEDLKAAVSRGYTWTEENPVGEWKTVYLNHCNDWYDQEGIGELTIPLGFIVSWDGVRPEMDKKTAPQVEVYPEDPPNSGVGFLRFNVFKWWLSGTVPVQKGLRTKLRAAIMVVAHGFDGAPTKLGDCGMRIGISPDGVRSDSTLIQWSEWSAVRDGPGGNLTEYEWAVIETPEFVPTVDEALLWVQCNANVKADISAGHYDRLEVLQFSDAPSPPGEYRVVVYDPLGKEVASCSFPVSGGHAAEICALANQIAALSCEV